MLDGLEDVVVVDPRAVGSAAQPVGGSGGTVWFLFHEAVYSRLGGACGWWRARSAVSCDPSSPWCGGWRALCWLAWTVAAPARRLSSA